MADEKHNCLKKINSQNRQKKFTSKFIRTNLRFSPLNNSFNKEKCFQSSFLSVNFNQKNSTKLIKNFFCRRPSEDLFLHPHFRKQECYFFLAIQWWFPSITKVDGYSKNRIQFFYKQLKSGRSPQSCLYFQDFQGSKLLNGCVLL